MKLKEATKNQVIAGANGHCQECGSPRLLQIHHASYDPITLECLRARCHAKKHPKIPMEVFFSRQSNRYWNNMSARSLGRRLNCCSRTIIRHAQKLGIASGGKIDLKDKKKLAWNIKSRALGSLEWMIKKEMMTMPKARITERR